MKRIILIVILCIYSFLSSASEPKKISENKKRNWSISVFIAGSNSDVQDNMEKAIIDAGFNDKPISLFLPSSSFPAKYDRGVSWKFSIKRRLKKSFYFGISSSKTYHGEIYGYDKDAKRLDIESSSYCLSAMLIYNLNNVLDIGIGPAWLSNELWKTSEDNSDETDSFKENKIGFTAGISAKLPQYTRFFFEFNFQLRKVGKMEVGPFYGAEPQDEPSFEKQKINFDHTLTGLGLGIRF